MIAPMNIENCAVEQFLWSLLSSCITSVFRFQLGSAVCGTCTGKGHGLTTPTHGYFFRDRTTWEWLMAVKAARLV